MEYDALGHHCIPRCDENLLVMIVSYQEEYFEKRQWELETGRAVQARSVIFDMALCWDLEKTTEKINRSVPS